MAFLTYTVSFKTIEARTFSKWLFRMQASVYRFDTFLQNDRKEWDNRYLVPLPDENWKGWGWYLPPR